MWWFRPVTLYRGLLFFDMMTFIFAFQVLCDGVYPKTWKVTNGDFFVIALAHCHEGISLMTR